MNTQQTAVRTRSLVPFFLFWVCLAPWFCQKLRSDETTATPQALFEQAIDEFFRGDPKASAQTFDKLIAVQPSAAPKLWQHGLALYYAERFDDGRKQFELHKTVNPNDIENPAWHYLCVARLRSPEEARLHMLPVGNDTRVPMKEILALYKGQGSKEAVLEAAEKGEAGQDLRNQLCYAHLYLGLYAEAHDDTIAAKRHMVLAATRYRMDHFMGRVARLHASLRGWLQEP